MRYFISVMALAGSLVLNHAWAAGTSLGDTTGPYSVKTCPLNACIQFIFVPTPGGHAKEVCVKREMKQYALSCRQDPLNTAKRLWCIDKTNGINNNTILGQICHAYKEKTNCGSDAPDFLLDRQDWDGACQFK